MKIMKVVAEIAVKDDVSTEIVTDEIETAFVCETDCILAAEVKEIGFAFNSVKLITE